jgi:DnaK suppressor protein
MTGGVVIMAAKTQKKMRDGRYDELRKILEDRRFEIIGEMQHKMHDVRAEGAAATGRGVRDEAESSEAVIQDDIEFALLQMKAETLHKIKKALLWLEVGTYGHCYECGEEIPEQRLRALLFAVRCIGCEEERETTPIRGEVESGRRVVGFQFVDMIG